MSATTFPIFVDFIERPDLDGQPLHRTVGDPGGATSYGWTYGSWSAYAKLHGLDASFAYFSTMTRADFTGPTRAAFWNTIMGDSLPAGVDLIWADFHFGSGGATRILQGVVGALPDGDFGQRTLAAAVAASVANLAGLLSRMTAARKSYYATLADYAEFGNGWDRRADACLQSALALWTPSAVLAQSAVATPSTDDLNAEQLAKDQDT